MSFARPRSPQEPTTRRKQAPRRSSPPRASSSGRTTTWREACSRPEASKTTNLTGNSDQGVSFLPKTHAQLQAAHSERLLSTVQVWRASGVLVNGEPRRGGFEE